MRLRVDLKALERIGRNAVRQDAKHDDLLFFGQVGDQLREIRRRPFGKHFPKRGKIPRLNHFLDFGFDEIAEHGGVNLAGRIAIEQAGAEKVSFFQSPHLTCARELPGLRPQIPPADFRRRRRAGAHYADAEKRHRAEPARACLSCSSGRAARARPPPRAFSPRRSTA